MASVDDPFPIPIRVVGNLEAEKRHRLDTSKEQMCSQSIPFLRLELRIVGAPVAEHRV